MKYTVISFDDLSRLDSSCASIFREKLAQVNTENDAVLIDLTGVNFIDSRGLGAIIAAVNSTRGETKMFLCGVKENVRRIMELTRVHTLLSLYPSVTAALEMLQQESRELKNAA
ncbi:STAS domain-containing protein [Candidatus Electrothrix sp.]|uniref:STAS domain-containing protein n=1 Tax=Candidatus Electrothrix sp. TaxID=2170559 RepID=UPI0040578BCE